MKRLGLLSLLLVLSHLAFSQQSSIAYLKLADSLYKNDNYSSAAVYYQRALKKATQPGYIMLQTARSYSKINNIKEAQTWFEKAKSNHVAFSTRDTYEYIRILTMLQKRDEAIALLSDLVKEDSTAVYAKQMMEDIRNPGKYYQDSTAYVVSSLPFNTEVSEFAPVFYKNGIVFSSAKAGNFMEKKYYWDNSGYLNLYYGAKETDTTFQKPVVFDKSLNTHFHDGPASFYSSDEKMIINRNRQFKGPDANGTRVWQLALYDGQRSKDKKSWELTWLPLEPAAYAYAHPSISADGNVLYFVSDRPGGYGGTDIYRVTRENGTWSKPFNLGPGINTPNNEVFPFFIDNTLYFASNGHGGLGGLDIFKSEKTKNGFTPPVNLGYPINSPQDDFSFITNDGQQTGYFASSRNGNDDLFMYHKEVIKTRMLVHTYDETTKTPLKDAEVEIILATGENITTTSDESGTVQLDLPEDTPFIIVVNKDKKVGSSTGIASKGNEELDVYLSDTPADTTTIKCIGVVKDESGEIKKPFSLRITDEATGEDVTPDLDNSMISFKGEKSHTYKIEAANERGDTSTYKLAISEDEEGSKTWSMVMQEKPLAMNMAARIFNAEDNTPLGGARVTVITFNGPDLELTANDDGIVEFTVDEGTAYMIEGTKDKLSGMYTGVAEPGTDKASIIHPVPAYGDRENKLPVVTMITNEDGDIIKEFTATVTDKSTGEQIAAETKDGLLSFLAEKGKDYVISIEAEDHKPASKEVSIPQVVGSSTEKISIALERIKTENNVVADQNTDLPVTGRVTDKEGKVITDAIVTVTEKSSGKQIPAQLQEGVLNFTGDKGKDYVITVNDENHQPATQLVSIPEEAADTKKINITLKDKNQTLPVAGRIADKNGNVITNATVTVTEKSSGKQIPAQLQDGVLNFTGDKGKDYVVTVNDENHEPATEVVSIPQQATDTEKINITLDDKNKQLPVAGRITDKNRNVITNATVTVTEKSSGKQIPAQLENGVLNFTGDKGKDYVVMVNDENYQPATKVVTIPQQATDTEKIDITLEEKTSAALPVVGHIIDEAGHVLNDVNVTVVEKDSGEKIPVGFKNGIFSFYGKKGKEYTVTAGKKDYEVSSKDISVTGLSTDIEKIAITLSGSSPATQPALYQMAVHVFNADNNISLGGARVTVITFTDPDREFVTNGEGIAEFALTPGTPYVVMATKDDLSGMHAGEADEGTDKASVIHPVPAYANSQVPVAAQLKDPEGTVINEGVAMITDKATSEQQSKEITNGILTFLADRGKEYTISVDKNNKSLSGDISLPVPGNPFEKIVLDLKESVVAEPVLYQMAARIFKADDNAPLSEAKATIVTFTDPDVELVANTNGVIEFTLAEGTPYVIMANKDEFSGMYASEADAGTDKNSITHPVPAYSSNHVPVVAQMTDSEGEIIDSGNALITNKATSEQQSSEIRNGLLTFLAERGNEYSILVNDKNNNPLTTDISVADEGKAFERFSLALEEVEPVEQPQLIQPTSAVDTAAHVEAKQLPVVAVITDNNGRVVTEASVMVIDNTTGERIPARVENGKVEFTGVQGNKYKVEVTANNFKPEQEVIDVDQLALNSDPLRINLSPSNPELPESPTLIIFGHDSPDTKFYLSSGESLDAITGRNDSLYLENQNGRRTLGKGTLAELKNNPDEFMPELGLPAGQIFIINTIYFDFNSSRLDQSDRYELDKVKSILQHYPSLHLTVNSHADDRGSDDYNFVLSKRRARSVEAYLIQKGIPSRQIIKSPHGETLPAVPCSAPECTEEERQKNRRAEFAFFTVPDNQEITARAKNNASKGKATSGSGMLKYSEAIEKYGDVQVEGLSFKVTIGAYRYNHTLTFDELKDLGTPEKKDENGITYYYLAEFSTLRSVEETRQQVIQRGVADAGISIYYNGEKIKFSKFLSLVEER